MTDIFAIAASLSINGGQAMRFLEDFGAKLLQTHDHMEKLQGQLEHTRRLAVGLGAAFIGYETLRGLKHLADHAKELNHEQSMLLRNGISYREVLEETGKAFRNYTQAVPTATGADFLRTANELVSVKGTLKGADEALVQSLKIEGLIGNATGKSAEGQGYDFWRAVEDKGIIQNKEKTDAMLNAMAQGTIATGGKITGQDWFTYARRAGTAWMSDSIDALPMQVMQMQTMGAPGAGVSRRTFANMIEGGQKLTKAQIAAWGQVGMMDAHGIAGREQEITRPDLFIQKAIDSLQKHGIMGEEATKLWASHALNRKGADYFMTGYMGMTERDSESGLTRLEKERANLGRAQPLDQAYGTMMKTDYGANMSALAEQWKSLMQAAGGPAALAAIPVLQQLTSVFQKIGAFANEHQDFAKVATEITAVGAALLTLAGSVKAAQAALAIANGMKGGAAAGGGGLASAEGMALAAAAAGGKGSPLSRLGIIRHLGVAGLAYDAYSAGDINSDENQALRASNQKSIGDIGRAVRDMMPEFIKGHMRFSDDPMPEGARPAFPHTPTPVSRFQHGEDGNALHRNDEMPKQALERSVDQIPKLIGDRLGEATKSMGPSVDKALKPVGDTITAGVGKIPGEVSPAISSAFAAIGAQISAAVRGIAAAAGAAAGAAAAGGRRVLPDPIPGAINYRGPSVGAPPVRAQTASFVIHNHTVLDKKIVASSVTRFQAARGRFPTSVGAMDMHGHFGSPGTPMLDSA